MYDIDILKNKIKNTENLIKVTKDVKQKEALQALLKQYLNQLHVMRRTPQINNKNIDINTNHDKSFDIDDVVNDYIKQKCQYTKNDLVELHNGKKGYVEDIYFNSREKNEKYSGILVSLKRCSKFGKKGHLWLSKNGVYLEDIKKKV